MKTRNLILKTVKRNINFSLLVTALHQRNNKDQKEGIVSMKATVQKSSSKA